MVAFHIALCRQVFQVDPYRFLASGACLVSGTSYEFRSNFAAEGLYHHIGGCFLRTGGRGMPVAQLHAGAALRRHPGQGRGVVYPQPYALALPGQLGCQTPAHANIAKVVDHAAEHVPLQCGLGGPSGEVGSAHISG